MTYTPTVTPTLTATPTPTPVDTGLCSDPPWRDQDEGLVDMEMGEAFEVVEGECFTIVPGMNQSLDLSFVGGPVIVLDVEQVDLCVDWLVLPSVYIAGVYIPWLELVSLGAVLWFVRKFLMV